MRKIDNNTIYKLYMDTKIKPTRDLYIKPLAGLASSSIALALATNIASDNNTAESVSIGMITYFGLSCAKNIKQYIKEKNLYKSNCSKLNDFNKKIQDAIGTEYDLNINKVVVMPNMDFSTAEKTYYMEDIIFEDNSRLSEIIENDEYSCLFYKDKDLHKDRKDAIDITEIAKKILER